MCFGVFTTLRDAQGVTSSYHRTQVIDLLRLYCGKCDGSFHLRRQTLSYLIYNLMNPWSENVFNGSITSG